MRRFSGRGNLPSVPDYPLGAAEAVREPQPIQLRPGRWIGVGYLAPARNIADVFCFLPNHPGASVVSAWSKLTGVSVYAGQHRYLRYVLTHSAD